MGLRETVNKNAWQVIKYLELWHRIERAVLAPDSPMNRKERGESKPPVGNLAHRLWDANRTADTILRPELERVEKSDMDWRGLYFSEVIRDTRYDPGVIRRWRAGQTREDREKWQALWMVAQKVAYEVAQRMGPEYLISVYFHPGDEEARPKTNAARGAERTADARRKYREMVRRLEEIEAEHEGISRKAACGMLADEREKEGKDGSYGLIRKAITFVNAERADPEAANKIWEAEEKLGRGGVFRAS